MITKSKPKRPSSPKNPGKKPSKFKFNISQHNLQCFVRKASRSKNGQRKSIHTPCLPDPDPDLPEKQFEKPQPESRPQPQSTSPDFINFVSNSIIKKIETQGVGHEWNEDEVAKDKNKLKCDLSPEGDPNIWSLPWSFSVSSLGSSSKQSFKDSEETSFSNPSTARNHHFAYTEASMSLGMYMMPLSGFYPSQENFRSFQVQQRDIEKDGRTTLMIRHIPNKYSLKLISDQIDQTHVDAYDFLYLPFDYNSHCNVGYAFINFVSQEHLKSFYQKFHGRKWAKYNSDKICEIKYARLQGRNALIEHFHNSKVLNQREKKFRPIIKDPRGLNKTIEEKKKNPTPAKF